MSSSLTTSDPAANDPHATRHAPRAAQGLGPARPAVGRGDAQVLSEALGNLIVNAVAYSPHGSKVGVGVKRVDDVVEIAVTDRGIGIPEADQQRIFERFYRADQARSHAAASRSAASLSCPAPNCV